MKDNRNHSKTVILGKWFMFVGIWCCLYPLASNWLIKQYFHAETIRQDQRLQTADQRKYVTYAKQANRQLALKFQNIQDFLTEAENQPSNIYSLQTGKIQAISTIYIPKIDCQLPVYEGTSDEVLALGAGHLRHTSYPIGGKSSHTVLAAHNGLLNGEYFQKLPKLKKGDYFFIKNSQQTLAYQVFRIQKVTPNQRNLLKIKVNQDLATLITCVPLGVNSHRLLVTGRRIDIEQVKHHYNQLLNQSNQFVAYLSQHPVSLVQFSRLVRIFWLIIGIVICGGYLIIKRRIHRQVKQFDEEGAK